MPDKRITELPDVATMPDTPDSDKLIFVGDPNSTPTDGKLYKGTLAQLAALIATMGSYSVDNGLHEDPTGNFKLGGTILEDTLIGNGLKNINISDNGTFSIISDIISKPSPNNVEIKKVSQVVNFPFDTVAEYIITADTTDTAGNYFEAKDVFHVSGENSGFDAGANFSRIMSAKFNDSGSSFLRQYQLIFGKTTGGINTINTGHFGKFQIDWNTDQINMFLPRPVAASGIKYFTTPLTIRTSTGDFIADLNGLVDLTGESGGGGSAIADRFGLEDVAATENRTFDLSTFNFKIQRGTTFSDYFQMSPNNHYWYLSDPDGSEGSTQISQGIYPGDPYSYYAQISATYYSPFKRAFVEVDGTGAVHIRSDDYTYLDSYGSGSKSGVPTYMLGVTVDGRVVEVGSTNVGLYDYHIINDFQGVSMDPTALAGQNGHGIAWNIISDMGTVPHFQYQEYVVPTDGTTIDLFYQCNIENISYLDGGISGSQWFYGGITAAHIGDHQQFVYQGGAWWDSQLINVSLGLVNEYTDNADAIANGLGISRIYRTGDFLKIVH